MKSVLDKLTKALFVGGLGWILWSACREFYQIAWGSGEWMGEFSATWALLYSAFVFVNILILVLCFSWVLRPGIFTKYIERFVTLRRRMGNPRWVLWLFVFLTPVLVFQFTAWGVVLQKFYIRILVWIVVACLLAILVPNDDRITSWRPFLSMLILSASLYTIASSFLLVNDFPFSQGWSEGNRLWDYSVLFGRDRYLVPPGKDIPVLLDIGRQFIGGLPFLIPVVSIKFTRLWVGLTQIIPYILLGLALFRNFARDRVVWLVLTFWTFLFLRQGPIHPPLVICATLVAMAWRAPLWRAIPLLLGAGYLAQASRFTWIFAPGIWIFMLEFASAAWHDRKSSAPIIKRTVLLAAVGILGGVFLPGLIAGAQAFRPSAATTPAAVSTAVVAAVPEGSEQVGNRQVPGDDTKGQLPPFLEFVIRMVTVQPLLWYRLLPNSTYGNGILFALLLAAGPLVALLLILIWNGIWQINRSQKFCLLLPLIAFFAVGLVASTKIGGGGDLHNMDMFLIGLLFTGAIAWNRGAGQWLQNGPLVPGLVKSMIVFSIVNAGLGPLQEIRPYDFGKDAVWIKTLTDAPSEKALGMLPLQPKVDSDLQAIQQEVDAAALRGEILFMDQRQLLTFGYVSAGVFVPEYEKKYLMNEAMSENSAYFGSFYSDLAAHRFSLIISEVLRTPIKDSSFQFGEENNAWVKWVANPVLCYYQEKDTLKDVGVQLLVPKSEPADCSAELP